MTEALFTANNVWMMVCTALVFIMHLGFSSLEVGLTRSKNSVNILFKNVMIICIGLLTYAFVGFNLMYPGDNICMDGWFGFAGFGLDEAGDVTAEYASGGYTYWTDFLFQGMFAATAATIVSGAVAERMKLESFLIFSVFLVALIYPMIGMWHWGGGWLSEKGFHDFAGSTLVHSVGGWAALVAVILIGPRLGRYKDGKSMAIEGHNLPLVAIGVFLLWFGWFGFNGGSVLSADPAGTSKVLVTTSLAAAAGGILAFVTSYIMFKSYDLTMALNGILAGLVSITAGADVTTVNESMLIGAIGGVLVVLAVTAMDKLKLDDPVGAIPVHLVCGIWGTLAVGIFAADKSFGTQLIGVLVIGAFCSAASLVALLILKYTIGLRVSESEEYEGLDEFEHKMSAYPDFRLNEH